MVRTLPSNAGGAGSIPGRGPGIPHGLRPGSQGIEQRQYCNKFNRDFKNDPHQKKKILKKRKEISGGFPGWCSGWESVCQCREHGFEPRSGKIPHAVEQLSPCTTTTEPVRHNY